MQYYRFTVRTTEELVYEVAGDNQEEAENELYDIREKNPYSCIKANVINEEITNVEELKERWFCCVYEDKGIKYRHYKLFPSFNEAAAFMVALRDKVISICEEDSEFTRGLKRDDQGYKFEE